MKRFSASPWAVLAAALLFYCSDGQSLLPWLPPILCHEAGHVLALALCGCRVTELRLELGGLSLRYAGSPGSAALALCALAGPLAGLFYAAAAHRCGPWGELSAGLSLLFSAFNLLPVPPLDGAQLAQALFSERAAAALGLACSWALLAAGVFLLASGKGAGLALAGLILTARQYCRTE